VTPEAARFLDKAWRLATGASALLEAGFIEAAGRDAYLSGYHAAQCLITIANGARGEFRTPDPLGVNKGKGVSGVIRRFPVTT
jgi:hypothetical protein